MKCVKASIIVAILAMTLVLTMGQASYSRHGVDNNPIGITTSITSSGVGATLMSTLLAPAPAPVVSPPKVKKPPPKGHKPYSNGLHRYDPPRIYDAKSGKGTYKYWQSNPSKIPKIFVSNMATIDTIFGSTSLTKYGYKFTVLDALESNNESNIDNGYTNLARQAITSLLNAYTVKNYVYTPEQVHELFNDALVSLDTATKQAMEFEEVNLLV